MKLVIPRFSSRKGCFEYGRKNPASSPIYIGKDKLAKCLTTLVSHSRRRALHC